MSLSYGIPAGMEDDDFEDVEDDFVNSVQKTCENMKITVLPDITIRAGLNGENFDAALPLDVENWFQSYKQMWTIYKNTPTMVETLGTLYANCDNPLLIALKLFANCPDCINVKNKSLPFTIMEKISTFKASRPEIANQCTDNMRMVAFNFVKEQQLPSLFKLVTSAYDLTKSKHLFEDKITELITLHYYKDASIWAILLGLTHKFGVLDIVLPLVLQDKISVAEEYLDAAPHLQRPTIELLDSLLDKRASVYNNCGFYIGKYCYTDIKKDKLQAKPLTKLITRLAQKYKIPPDATPHMNRAKSFGYLQYLVHKKYVEKSLSTDSWRELVQDTLHIDYQDMHIDFICSITYYNDFEESAYWAQYFNLSIESLPPLLQDYLNSETSNKENDKLQNLEANNYQKDNTGKQTDKSNYHTLNLNERDLILVDNVNLFNEMIQVLKVQNLVAFDSEWKPSCNAGNVISLIQIATRKTVYLIDALEPSITNAMWSRLGRDVFNNGEILKLGFSLTSDIIMFQKTLPVLGISLQVQSSYLDLQIVWRKIADLKGFRFPYTENSSSIRLSALVELCLGKPLDKSNQLSNWGSRPLRKEQLMYAALDAYCLLEVYDVLSTRLTELGVDINDFAENTLFDNILKKSKKKFPVARPRIEVETTSVIQTSFKATDIKFISDEMLEGLAKALRKCGIDVICMSSKQQRNDIINKAITENRYLLTRGSSYVEMSHYLPPKHNYQVTKDMVDDQLAEILAHFNITVTEENIFSRCMKCNSNRFILASQDHIKIMKYGTRNSSNKQDNKLVEPPKRSFVLSEITSHICASGVTSTGARIQVDNIHRQIVNNVVQFYICEDCGKCYWEGDHFQRVMCGKLKDLITK